MHKTFDVSRLVIAALTAMTVVGIGTNGASPVLANTTSVNEALAQRTVHNTSATLAGAQAGNGQVVASVDVTRSLYIPALFRTWPIENIFGIETSNLSASAGGILSAGPTWVRRNALLWKDIETSQNTRNWSAAKGLEDDMIVAAKNNVRTILIIWGTPDWAQQIAGKPCGPMRSDKIGAFAAFMKDVVARYSQPPYSVKYFEIWNEPDFPSAGTPGANYGCWGNEADPYNGGGYYGTMLQQVAPQMRAANPSVKILLGGLLLACTPAQAGGCPASKFLEGILRAGGGSNFDGVSFHAYDAFDAATNQVGKYSWPSWNTSNANGPSLIVKTQFVKSVLSQFGVSGKFLINTEVGLLCWDCVAAPSNFEATKAYYLATAYSAAIAEGLVGNVWFTWEGWNLTGLAGPSLNAYNTARAELSDATYNGAVAAGDVGGVSGVKGYKYTHNGKGLWLVWSLDGSTKNITLPGTPAKVIDAVGATQSPAATLALSAKPLYIEFP